MGLSFRELQQQIQPDWAEGCTTPTSQYDLLVVPSLSLEQREMELVQGVHHYEERQLFALTRLRYPGVRIVVVTSKLLPELVVDAVLELLPGVPTSHARQRLQLFDTDDASAKPLTAKLLERPALLGRLREHLRPGQSFISCFNVTPLEQQLSEQLQIPILGTAPDLAHLGTKAGSRALFQRCGVPHPPGTDLVFNLSDLAEASAELWEAHPNLAQFVVKLNEGFSGEGNAPLDLARLELEGLASRERRSRLHQALESLAMPTKCWRELLGQQGALVEAWVGPKTAKSSSQTVCSPSVQGTIHPGQPSQVAILSTHEQVLAGPHGQTYQGCRFPADEPYRLALMGHGKAIGEALALEGALGHYAMDFVACRKEQQWNVQAIEINLRQGGTTYPYMALCHTTSGQLNPGNGLFLAPNGQALFYEATDNLCDPRLRGLLPVDLLDIVARAGLHFDPAQQRGSLFHLLGCLSEFGKLGMTCIGHSPKDARQVYDSTTNHLLKGALTEGR
ncbi:MAG TPA: peptide ligase PGM1-related protein [Prochlorococcus sp.]